MAKLSKSPPLGKNSNNPAVHYIPTKELGCMDNSEKEDEYDYYIAHDSIGVSHVVRVKKGKPPNIRCVGCDD